MIGRRMGAPEQPSGASPETRTPCPGAPGCLGGGGHTKAGAPKLLSPKPTRVQWECGGSNSLVYPILSL